MHAQLHFAYILSYRHVRPSLQGYVPEHAQRLLRLQEAAAAARARAAGEEAQAGPAAFERAAGEEQAAAEHAASAKAAAAEAQFQAQLAQELGAPLATFTASMHLFVHCSSVKQCHVHAIFASSRDEVRVGTRGTGSLGASSNVCGKT